MKSAWKLFLLVLVALAVLCVGNKSEDAGSGLEEAGLEGCDSTGLKIENEQMKSKIHALAMDLKHKDVIIFEKDGTISEKSEKVAALQSDLAAIQGRKASDAKEKVTKAEARVADLKKLIAGLEAKIGKQKKEKDAAEAKSVRAESRNNVLSIKLEELQKTIDQEQAKVRKTERALRAAEDEIVRIKSEAICIYISKLHEHVDPYYQEAKKVTKPYVEHVASISRPHVEKVTLALKPFTEDAVRIYGSFIASASVYHSQVQAQVQETLKKYEWTKPFATREFEWFAASVLLALPVMILFRIFSSACSKKTKRTSTRLLYPTQTTSRRATVPPRRWRL